MQPNCVTSVAPTEGLPPAAGEQMPEAGRAREKTGSLVSVRRRFWGNIVITTVGVASVAGYVMLSLVINSQPSTSVNPGWVALLQPGNPLGSGELLLRVAPAVPGAPGDHPAVSYSVLACGDKPFRGVLLLGGQTRVDAPIVRDQYMITNADRVPTAPHVNTIPDLTLGLADTIWHLGPVQEIPIVIVNPRPVWNPQALTSRSGVEPARRSSAPCKAPSSELAASGESTDPTRARYGRSSANSPPRCRASLASSLESAACRARGPFPLCCTSRSAAEA